MEKSFKLVSKFAFLSTNAVVFFNRLGATYHAVPMLAYIMELPPMTDEVAASGPYALIMVGGRMGGLPPVTTFLPSVCTAQLQLSLFLSNRLKLV